MNEDIILPTMYLITIFVADVNDLIRGHWFYNNITSIIFWNVMGVLSLMYLIRRRKQ
jgi:hypothetical protein